MSENQNKSLFANLWERRVPQFVATYVGICWGILQFLIFATNRYGLANDYIDRFLIFALILLPAVGVFIYNHGAPGKDAWKKYEKVLIPVNFIVALVFAGLFGGGGEMNAAPTEVTVTTETGDTIVRLIPAMEQTKSFAIFPFLNKSGNEDEYWKKIAIPTLIKTDMEQDIRFFCLSPSSFDYELESNNHSIDDDDVPLSTYLEIAQDKIVDFFITGQFESGMCTVKVYETKTGEVFWEKVFENNSIFEIADVLNKELSNNLYLESNQDHIKFTDLPASNLISDKEEVFKLMYAKGADKSVENGKFMLDLYKRINEIDPKSAEIKADLASAYMVNSKIDSSKLAISQALDYADNLPERQKFKIRQRYYQINDQRDKVIPLMESWKKLYPRDYYPFNELINFYNTVQNTKKAKSTALEALDNGHGSRVLKRLAGICIIRKELDEAEQYIDEYYALFPDKRREEDTQLADIYLKKGEFEKAKQWYESISLLNPNDYDLSVKLANVYSFTGQFDKTESNLNQALKQAKLSQDSLAVYLQQVIHYSKSGQVQKFNQAALDHFNLMSPGANKTRSIATHMQLASVYAYMGQEDTVLAMVEDLKTMAPHLYDIFSCIVDFLVSMVTEEKERFEHGMSPTCNAILTQSTPTMQYLVDGVKSKYKKDYTESIRMFETYLDTTESDRDNFGGWIAELHRLNGDNKASIKYCLESMELHPYEGTFLLELSKAYLADGQTKKAKEVYTKLKTKVWHKAEPEFYYYKDLEALEEALSD